VADREVGDAHGAVVVDHDAARVDRAVGDAGGVGGRDPVDHRASDRGRDPRRQGPTAGHEILEALAAAHRLGDDHQVLAVAGHHQGADHRPVLEGAEQGRRPRRQRLGERRLGDQRRIDDQQARVAPAIAGRAIQIAVHLAREVLAEGETGQGALPGGTNHGGDYTEVADGARARATEKRGRNRGISPGP
jgi:hypothetical protein